MADTVRQDHTSGSRRFYQRLAEHGDTAAMVLDAEGHVCYCTPAVERWLGHSAPLVGSRPFHLVHPDDAARVLRTFQELIVTPGEQRSLRLRVRGSAGEWRSIEINATNALDDRDVLGVMMSARDVTDTARLTDALFHAQRMELMGRLAAGIAHDFNNALTIILSHADLIALDKRCAVDVTDIRAAALSAGALTRRLLSLGRKQHGHMTDVNINDMLEGVHALLRPVLGERISFTCSPTETPLSVFIDPTRLEQALVNLVLNARDAISDRGFIRISCNMVDRKGSETDGSTAWARIRVCDNGHGMTPAVAARMFDCHFTTKGAAGNGLGLAIVAHTVREAGGTIRVESTPELGTSVELLLPAATLQESTPASQPSPEVAGGRETVVLVEDDAAVRQSVARTLHDAGYTVLEVPTVIDGVWLSDELLSRAALIIADEVLPDSSGHELIATFRHRRPGVPVLYVSGYPLMLDVARHLDEQTAFLPKPFDRDALLKHVRRLIDSATAR